MPVRTVVTASLAVVLLAGTAAALPARGAPPAPATGAALSDLVVAEVGLGSRHLSAGAVALGSDTRGSRSGAGFTITPVEVDGTPYGEQRWTSTSAPSEPTAFDSGPTAPQGTRALLRWEGSVLATERRADERGSVAAGTVSLGPVHLLGLPVELTGSAGTRTSVDPGGSLSEKRLVVERLALPSIVDLLAALGLDVGALPPSALADLVDALGLADDAVRDAQAAVDLVLAPVSGALADATGDLLEADAAVEAADSSLAGSREALVAAAETLDTAARALDTVTRGAAEVRAQALPLAPLHPSPLLDPVLPAPLPTPAPLPSLPLPTPAPLPLPGPSLPLPVPAPTVPTVPSLPAPSLPPLDADAALDAYAGALAAYDDAVAAVERVLAQVELAETALGEVLDRIAALVAPARSELDALAGAAVAALDREPLLAVEDLEVRSRSTVAASAAEGELAELVTTVGEVRVLGEDVLGAPLSEATAPALEKAVAERLDLVSAALSDVAGLPRLDVPVPQVRLLQRGTSTADGPGGVGGTATTALQVVTVSLPAVAVPAAVAVPGAVDLPAVDLSSLAAGLRVSAVDVGTVSQPLAATFLALGDDAQLAGPPAASPGAPAAPDEGVGQPAPPATGSPAPAVPGTAGPAPSADGGASFTPAPVRQRAVPVASSRTLPRTGPADAGMLLAVVLIGAALALRHAGAVGRRA